MSTATPPANAYTPPASAPSLGFVRTGDAAILYWNGERLTLQRSRTLDEDIHVWEDVTDSPTTSPWTATGPETAYFRLRR